MQNYSQLNWIIVGCISLFGMGCYFKKLTRQQQQYRHKLSQFQRAQKQSKHDKFKPLQQISKYKLIHPQQKNVYFQILQPKYRPDTYKLFQRERSVFAKQPKYQPQDILEHQMGGQFIAIRNNKEKILCKLNDFHLSAHLLQQQRKDINLFKEINRLDPIVQSVATTLSSAANIAIYGKLYYDSNRLAYVIEPFFLSGAFKMPKVVQKFYKQKIQSNNLTKFAIFLGGLVLAYFTILSPIQSYLAKKKPQRWQQAIQHINDVNYFKNKDHIVVKGQSLLNCEKCRTKNVEVVYQCGHLSICGVCHERNQNNQCLLCGKVSKRFMKIYMA